METSLSTVSRFVMGSHDIFSIAAPYLLILHQQGHFFQDMDLIILSGN